VAFDAMNGTGPNTGVSGVLFYELRSPYGVLTRKMLAPVR